MIDRKQLVSSHNPVLTKADKESALTVGNGELGFTADITGLQTLYGEYNDFAPLYNVPVGMAYKACKRGQV